MEPKSARDRLRSYLEEHVGRVVDGRELAAVARVDSWTRRLRELREVDGMPISSHLDRSDLRPGQYVLESLERRPRRVSRPIDRELRLCIIERDGFTCQICGRKQGDEDPSNLGRPISLFIDHIDPDGPTEPENLRVLCSVCSRERSVEILKRTDLLSQVRRASRAEQLAALEWLRKKYPSGK